MLLISQKGQDRVSPRTAAINLFDQGNMIVSDLYAHKGIGGTHLKRLADLLEPVECRFLAIA